MLGLGLSIGAAQTLPLARYKIGGKAPAVIADYSVGAYGLNGAPVGFDALFSFTRLSAAWKRNALGHWVKVVAGEPRTGHHIWKDGKLVPAGIAISPDVRSNLAPISDPLVSDLLVTSNVSDGTLSAGPGLEKGIWFHPDALTKYAYTSFNPTVGVEYTFSLFLRMDDGSAPIPGGGGTDFQIVNNNAGIPFGGYTVEKLGDDGLYRVYAARIADTTSPNFGVLKWAANSGRGFTISGYQIVQGPYPGDYIHTEGSPVDVAAEGIQIDPVKLAEAIGTFGPERFTGFNISTGTWVDNGDDTWSIDGTQTTQQDLRADNLTLPGQHYVHEFDLTLSGGNLVVYLGLSTPEVLSAGSHRELRTSNSTNYIFRAIAGVAATVRFPSVRQVPMPEALTFLMKGTKTYADNDLALEGEPFVWAGGSTDFIDTRLRTQGSRIGQIQFRQRTPLGGQTILASATDALSPGVEVPFALAFVLSATEIEGFINGVSTGKTPYGGMGNLLSVPLQLFPTGTGTLEEFRIWTEALPSAAMLEATS